ncbi:MAG: hypothetical protein ACW98U_08300 [Candidatus Thorarchaeota archaeon]|jgi:hypothetical protein
MELKKHKNELATRMSLLDIAADNQLAKELIELHEAKCSACQEDRLSCTVRPRCMNRNFLNALIEIGVKPQDLPSFCYSQYLEQIRRYILEKKGRGMVDRRIPIRDLLSTLSVSSIRHFSTKFKKIWKKFSSANANNVMLMAGDGLLFRFDFSREIVTLNPIHDRIDTYDVFRLYCELFSAYYNLETSVSDLTLNWWLLTFDVKGKDPASVKSILKSESAKTFDTVYSDVVDDITKIRAEVVVDGESSLIEAGQLRDLFDQVSKL